MINKVVKIIVIILEVILNLNVNRIWLFFEGNGDDKIKYIYI